MLKFSVLTRNPHVARLVEHLRNPLYFNGYALTASSAATSIVGVLYWVVAARFYTADVLGRNSAAISTLLFLAGLSGLALEGTLVRFLPRAGRAAPRLIQRVYTASAFVALLVGIVFLAGTPLWSPALEFLRAEGWLAVFFVLAILAIAIFVQQDSALVGLRHPKWVVVENAVYAVVKLALLALLAGLLPRYGVLLSWVLPTFVLIPAVNYLIFSRLMRPHVQASAERAEPIRFGTIVKYASSDYGGFLFYQAYSMLPPLLVLQVVGAEASAYFYMPWMMYNSLRLLVTNMGISLTVEGSAAQGKVLEYFRAVLHRTAQLLVVVVATLVVVAPLVLGLFGSDYAREGTALLRWLALAALPNTFVSLYLSVTRVQNRFHHIVIIQGLNAVLLLGLSLLLLPQFGITGVGMAWLIGQSLMAVGVFVTQAGKLFRKGYGSYGD